jgi:hypothetical protein
MSLVIRWRVTKRSALGTNEAREVRGRKGGGDAPWTVLGQTAPRLRID